MGQTRLDQLPYLHELLLAYVYRVRRTAYEDLLALGVAQQEIAGYLLEQVLTCREQRKRQTALWMLRELGPDAKGCTDKLVQLLQDPAEDRLIRHTILETLHKIEPSAIPLSSWAMALSGYTIRNFERLFWLANDYLAAAKEKAATAVGPLAENPDPEVRSYAIAILGRISQTDQNARKILEQAKTDQCWYVRQAARFALDEFELGREERGKQLPVQQPVQVTESDGIITIANGLISMGINAANGIVESLKTGGEELLGPKGRIYYDNITHPGRSWRPTPDRYEIISDGEQVQVTLIHTATDQHPLDVRLNYVVRQGESGFYFYVTYAHTSDIPVIFGQARHVLRFDSTKLQYMAINDTRMGRMPTDELAAAGEEVMDATIRLGDGSVYSKYNWQVFEGEHLLHGIMGEGIGLWMMSASKEYYNGGPFKQNRTVHYDNVLLQVMQSGHFGAGGHFLPERSGWRKIYGPHFIYINHGENLAELWIDAKTQALAERAKWPYQWVKDELYPLQRVAVTGQLRIAEGGEAADGWIILGEPTPHWQHQGLGYQYYTKTDAHGRFTLPHVRPGTYTLWAYLPGTVGEFRLDGIDVTAAEVFDLGELRWTPVRHGKLLWRIGIPDRSGAEFFIPGGDYRNWGLWYEYPRRFPGGVQFKVGASDYRIDWNYCQPISVFGESGERDAEPWQIIFDLDQAPAGQGYLTIGIAASTENDLAVALNGHLLGTISRKNDNATYRSSIRGIYSEHTLEFPAALLQAGENRITLTITGEKGLQRGIIYDFIQLELEAAEQQYVPG